MDRDDKRMYLEVGTSLTVDLLKIFLEHRASTPTTRPLSSILENQIKLFLEADEDSLDESFVSRIDAFLETVRTKIDAVFVNLLINKRDFAKARLYGQRLKADFDRQARLRRLINEKTQGRVKGVFYVDLDGNVERQK